MHSCCILGLGYIGLPTSLIVSKAGHRVIGVDINKQIVEKLNNGIVHIKEPGIKELLELQLTKKRFYASVKPEKADIYIIAVPTPFYSYDNNIPRPNIEYINKAVKSILPYLSKGNLIILESTSPIGTTDNIARTIFKNSSFKNGDIYIAYCPERVLPGNIINELVSNNRVIGGIDEDSSNKAYEFYETFSEGNLLVTNSKTAELVKLSENAYRDVNIAFANELSIIADKFDINISELINIANQHPRVNILNPGCGVGGHCIAVDPWFIASSLPEDTTLIQTARKVNNQKVNWVINQIETFYKKNSNIEKKDFIIGIFGLSYKSNVDDLRESPSIKIALDLQDKGYQILACEPNINENKLLKLSSAEEILRKASLSVFLVLHDEFTSLNLKNLSILDFCGIKKI